MEEKSGHRRSVVIAMDSSASAEKAFKWYVENLRRPEDNVVMVTVVHVMDVFTPAQWRELMSSSDLDVSSFNVEKQRQTLEQNLEDLRVMMKEAKVDGTVQCIQAASASKGILAVAENCGADCIISGSRGARIFQVGVLGSTTEDLLHNSNVTLVVCPD
ncbi:uncharacterized protein LOC132547598 [Ylistrum balloti]|uniref:uncharacterized protein LOC132547598 n=1 Tax=Ylistrum balloti TaxID=509963 RepID=UPI002905B0FC|nr:uncharacterized protein LOC132547598 [Ylistrum balloti]